MYGIPGMFASVYIQVIHSYDIVCSCFNTFCVDTYRKIMNWHQHLIFSPELPPISHEAEDLIKRHVLKARHSAAQPFTSVY